MTRKQFAALAEIAGNITDKTDRLTVTELLVNFCIRENEPFDANNFRDAVEAERAKLNH